MKTAIAVISFGTTVPTALHAIETIEQAIAQRYGQRIFRAFTSPIVRRKIRARDGIDIPDPATLFLKLTEEGYSEIHCIPTHVIPGIEYEMLVDTAKQFPAVKLAKPLLWSESDYDTCVHAVMSAIPARQQNEALILMGHGTAHFANAAYCELDNKFRTEGYANVFVGTVEGYPSIDDIIVRLQAAGIKKAMLMPFMIVAGDHTRNDLYGDAPDSWKSRLHACGIETRAFLTGLGELLAIAEKFADHLQMLAD